MYRPSNGFGVSLSNTLVFTSRAVIRSGRKSESVYSLQLDTVTVLTGAAVIFAVSMLAGGQPSAASRLNA
jgi:hypothetical protein